MPLLATSPQEVWGGQADLPGQLPAWESAMHFRILGSHGRQPSGLSVTGASALGPQAHTLPCPLAARCSGLGVSVCPASGCPSPGSAPAAHTPPFHCHPRSCRCSRPLPTFLDLPAGANSPWVSGSPLSLPL